MRKKIRQDFLRIEGPQSMSPYARDWPIRILALIAQFLELPFRNTNSVEGSSHSRDPYPITIGLVSFALYSPVALLAAWHAGVLVSDKPDVIPLIKDYYTLALFIILPLAAATLFDFYRRVYRVVSEMDIRNEADENQVAGLSISQIRINSRFNNLFVQPIFLGISVFVIFQLGRGVTGAGDFTWFSRVSPIAFWWLNLWNGLYWYAVLSWAWKGLVTGWEIYRLSEAVPVSLNDKESNQRLQDSFNGVTSLWLRVHFMIVLLGVLVFLFTSIFDFWLNPAMILTMALYMILAPILFVGPFLPIHRTMTRHRDERLKEAQGKLDDVSELISRKKTLPESVLEDLTTLSGLHAVYRDERDNAKSIPTWPFRQRVRSIALLSYLVPGTVFVGDKGVDLGLKAMGLL